MKPLSTSEFNLVVRAKNGDASANIELWERYKPVVASMLKIFPRMNQMEKLSEGYIVFLHKLDLFNPEKVCDANKFTFSYMLTGGIKNLRKHLFYRLRHDSENVSFIPYEDAPESSHEPENVYEKKYPFLLFTNCGDDYEFKMDTAFERIRKESFDLYNPEIDTNKFSESELKEKEQLLYSKLTDLQKEILKLRKEKKLFSEIAEMLGRSDTNVRYHFNNAKSIAANIFYNKSETSEKEKEKIKLKKLKKESKFDHFRESVLKLMQEGKQIKEIAEIFGCSYAKVRRHYLAAIGGKND
jgi:DNA-binding NarL/FixJ family response regulator